MHDEHQSRWELSFMTHNFRGTTLAEVCQIANDLGIESLEVSAIKSHGNRPNSERWVDVYADPANQSATASDFGIKLNSLDLHCDMIIDDQAVDYLRQGIDFAAEAGIPTIVNGEGPKADHTDDDTAFRIVEERTLEVLEHCERRGIRYALEAHGPFSRTVDGLERMINISDSPYHVVNFEVGNLMRTPEMDTAQFVPRFINRIGHVHIKDKVFPADGGRAGTAVIGTGDVNIRGCLEALWSGGYQGLIVIEVFPTATGDPFEETRAGIEYVRAEMIRLAGDNGT